MLGEALDKFFGSLESQDAQLIKRKRRDFSQWLDDVEELLSS